MVEPDVPDDAVVTGRQRPAWHALPEVVRAAVEEIAGARVLSAANQAGGFSPGVAARLGLDDGRAVFAKAVSTTRSAPTADFHRREARFNATVRSGGPIPRMFGSYDDGDWVALVFESVDGHPPNHPWRREELDRVLAAITALSREVGTAPAGLPGAATTTRLGGWAGVRADRALVDRLPTLSPWAAGRLAELVDLEAGWETAVAGDALVHLDLWTDNVVLTENAAVLVDWAHARAGAAYVDVLMLLIGAALDGIDPEPIVATRPLTRKVEPELIDRVLAAAAGFLVRGGLEVVPADMAAIPAYKRTLAAPALAWLARRW